MHTFQQEINFIDSRYFLINTPWYARGWFYKKKSTLRQIWLHKWFKRTFPKNIQSHLKEWKNSILFIYVYVRNFHFVRDKDLILIFLYDSLSFRSKKKLYLRAYSYYLKENALSLKHKKCNHVNEYARRCRIKLVQTCFYQILIFSAFYIVDFL